MSRHVLVCLLTLCWTGAGAASAEVAAVLRGEAALSAVTSDIDPRSLRTDLRYVAELALDLPVGETGTVTFLGAVDADYHSRILSFSDAEGEGEVEAYRLWVRYGGGSGEIRLGRQKISFGSATLLRPLMWFDDIDPRDPLQITAGVDALLARYYLLNNANLWLWCLYGNEEPRGWEVLPADGETPEYGGRLQWPVGGGEVAFGYHHRRADLAALTVPGAPRPAERWLSEDRFGLDGKWDVTVGLWFETALVHQRHDFFEEPYRRFMSVGVDYTFGLGQGLTVLAEHLATGSAARAFARGELVDSSALSLRYPWGAVDEFGLILYRDWEANRNHGFAEWRRTYDRWSFHLMGFANPTEIAASPAMPASALLAGHGGRILVVFNH